jgi:formylglycine-generating enzyme required for sulfatase activity
MPSPASPTDRLEFTQAGLVPRTAAIPGGFFVMGADAGRPDEAPAHRVHVSAFELALTPVTNAQYAACVSAGAVAPSPWSRRPGFSEPDQPVVGVTWFEACRYTDWLSESTGETWRLPTEAEWERAARGGLTAAATAWGGELPAGEVPAGVLLGPWPVGRGTPNGFGLFDMGTIVHEWCADWYAGDYYADSPAWDPTGPADGERRASRGGSWRHHVRWSPPAARSSLPPLFRYSDYGFRVLRQPR